MNARTKDADDHRLDRPSGPDGTPTTTASTCSCDKRADVGSRISSRLDTGKTSIRTRGLRACIRTDAVDSRFITTDRCQKLYWSG